MVMSPLTSPADTLDTWAAGCCPPAVWRYVAQLSPQALSRGSAVAVHMVVVTGHTIRRTPALPPHEAARECTRALPGGPHSGSFYDVRAPQAPRLQKQQGGSDSGRRPRGDGGARSHGWRAVGQEGGTGQGGCKHGRGDNEALGNTHWAPNGQARTVPAIAGYLMMSS